MSFQNTSVEKDVSHVLYFAMITCSLLINNLLDGVRLIRHDDITGHI